MDTRPNFDVDAWLGPFADQTSEEHKEEIAAAARRIDERWPQHDLADNREAALNAAAQIILGDSTLEEIGGDWARKRAAEREAHAAMTGAIIATAGAGESEASIARRSGMTRVSVRKAVGKDSPTRVTTDADTGLPVVELGVPVSTRDGAEITDED